MRIYTMEDRSSGTLKSIDPNLTLQAVNEMTDWTADELDEIADMKIGDRKVYDSGVFIVRTN